MSAKPTISVIVPVYNAERFLPECLDSILAQDYTHWEAVLVDDGSTDGSPAICDAYARKDPRFKVFHKENGGVSAARNFGLEKAGVEEDIGPFARFICSLDWNNSCYLAN